jgi:hypothetical protein
VVGVLDFKTAACACAAALHASRLEVWYVVYKYSMRMNLRMNTDRIYMHLAPADCSRTCFGCEQALVFVVAYALVAAAGAFRGWGFRDTLKPTKL